MSDDRERAGVYVGGPVAAKGNVTIGQNIAAGDGATVTGSTPPPNGTGTERDADRVGIRLGFVVDVAGYGPRSMPDRGDVQRRLHALVQEVLLDLGVDPSTADKEGTGDGMIVLLPEGGQFQRLLPLLLQTMTRRLAADNRRHTDRIRLRMATSIGPVGHGAAGFTEDTVTEMSRLVDSDAPRTRWSAIPRSISPSWCRRSSTGGSSPPATRAWTPPTSSRSPFG